MEIENNSSINNSTSSKEFGLGILLVHGIGMQSRSETLKTWTNKLIEIINKANPDSLKALVQYVENHDSDYDSAKIEIDFHKGDGGEYARWLVTEGWWADEFPEPSFPRLFSWSLRAMPWFIANYLAGFRPLVTDKQGKIDTDNNARWDIRALPRRIIAYFILPVVILILGLLLVVAIPPIPVVRSFVIKVQSILTATVGDSLVYIKSDDSAKRMMFRILNPLRNMKECCDHTIVIAHSQGAALCVHALGGIETTRPGKVSSKDDAPDTLLTFGAGTNPLLNLQGNYPKLFSNIVWLEVVPLFAALGLLGFLVHTVLVEEVTVFQASNAVGVAIASILAALFVVAVIIGLAYKLISEKWTEKLLLPIILLGLVVGVVAALSVALRSGLPLSAVFFVAVMFFVIFGVVDVVARTVRKSARIPPGLSSWIDLYASSDPVPNGQTRVEVGNKDDIFNAIKIYNEGSLLTDHTTYWRNLDGFVLRVAHACARTARIPWLTDLLTVNEAGDQRAKWRVNHLRLVKWVLTIGSLVALVMFWNRFNDLQPPPLDWPEWTRHLIPLILVFFAWLAAIIFLHFVWRRWVRSEQEQAIAGSPPHLTPWWPFIQMGVVIGLNVLLVVSAGYYSGLLQMPTVGWAGLVLLSVIVGISLELVARGLIKAPKPVH